MAARPPSGDHGETHEKGEGDSVDHVPEWLRECRTALQVKEWVHRMVTTGLYGKEDDGADPGDPDAPFDPVKLATARWSLVDGRR